MAEIKEPESLKGKVEVTAEQTIAKLREIVQPPGKKGTWLRHLNDRQLAEVYHRLRLKQTVYHIAMIAQKEWRILPKSEIKSLCRALKDFKEKTLGLLQVHEQSFPQTEEKKKFVEEEKKRAETIIRKVDGLEELSWLIKTQRERLEVLIGRESKAMPFKFTDKTVETLGKLLDTYLDYQMQLGVLKAKPKEIDLTLKTKWDGLLEGVLPDDGTRIISASQRLLELADKKALILKRGEDGKYFLEDKNKETQNAPGEQGDSSS